MMSLCMGAIESIPLRIAANAAGSAWRIGSASLCSRSDDHSCSWHTRDSYPEHFADFLQRFSSSS